MSDEDLYQLAQQFLVGGVEPSDAAFRGQGHFREVLALLSCEEDTYEREPNLRNLRAGS